MESAAPIFDDIAASALAVVLRESAWVYPVLETLHIIGVALVLGGILVFDVRLIGMGRDIAVSALGRHVIPWVLTGISANIVTGTLLFVSDAAEFSTNASLRVKLLLIVLATINAAVFQRIVGRDTSGWDRGVKPPTAARLQGALSIALWVGVVTAGRMMAYIK